MSEARFFEAAGEALRCTLCPHQCRIPEGGWGLCRVRENHSGVLALPYSAYITAIARDPIEKKPLYHFRPGASILSLGFAGCNLRCPFCQNWHISQIAAAAGDRNNDAGSPIPGRFLSPAEAVALAAESPGSPYPLRQIAYTYSEPLIHAEYLIDCMKLARAQGIANVLVTNGCINEKTAAAILPFTDAANIDLKCFSEETYAKVLGGNLQAVLNFIRMAHNAGVHVEITTLVIPGLNDSNAELDKCAAFIAGLSKKKSWGFAFEVKLRGISALAEIPWHLSAYHPDYRWDAPPTDPARLIQIAEQAQKTLRYVYTGNIGGGSSGRRFTDTACPHCGKVVVRRQGYSVDTGGLKAPADGEQFYRCAACGGVTGIRG
ncbi:AmmeMemoRadiSam system radical SAM enzyme [Spirochaetia bacterium]|nr:AmmeMemoRadiSam system radical SAM enzyme [Spirochaetia bacterium]